MSHSVVWHDLECGLYTADLQLWRELAQAASGPVLEIGAGTGRVALDLAARGHQVTALDLDAELLSALHERALARGGAVETVCADAHTFELECRDFALCIVAMQTLQLFDGSGGRLAFLQRARAHLRTNGVLACAIVTEIESFDCASGDRGPSPEVTNVGGLRYVSHATRVHVGERRVRIQRERSVTSCEQPTIVEQPTLGRRTSSEHTSTREAIELDRVTVAELTHEGLTAGLRAAGTRSIPATDEHAGSVAVLFSA